MANVTEVRRVMVNESGVVVDELDYITDDVITARVTAVEIDPACGQSRLRSMSRCATPF